MTQDPRFFLNGVVRDSSGLPVPYAKVWVEGGPDVAMLTNDDGTFLLTVPAQCECTLVCYAEGFVLQKMTMHLESSSNSVFEIELIAEK